MASTDLARGVDDARSFVTSFAVNPTSQSTPHVYLSSLPFCPHSSSVYINYRQRLRGLLELKGSLMEAREGAPLAVWSLGWDISSFALSPDGTRVVIGCDDSTVRILSAYNGTTELGPLEGHTNTVTSVAFSSDGRRAASVSVDGIRIWNVYNGSLIIGPFKNQLGHLISVSFSPDGALVATGDRDCNVRVWNAYNGAPLFDPLADHLDLVSCVIFSPNGSHIAAPSAGNSIQLWNSFDGTPFNLPFSGHTASVKCLAFTPDSTRLVSGSLDMTVRVWNVSDGSLVTSPIQGHEGPVDSVAVSPDGERVASSGLGVRIWNIDDGALVAGPFYHTPDRNSLAYSPDGNRIIFASNRRIIVRNVRKGMYIPSSNTLRDILTGIQYAAVRPDGTHFLTTGQAGALRIWNVIDGSFITSTNKAEFMPSSFSTLSPDGSYIISTLGDTSLRVVNLVDASLAAGPFEIERSDLSTLGFSRNNAAVIMGCLDGTIKVCDLKSGNTAVGSFVAHRKRVSSISETPDCSLLVSHSDYEMAIRVWNITAPALDLPLFNISISPSSGHNYSAVYDGWSIREDGWVVNNSQHLLFWLPPDLAEAWCSPYATLAITQSGTLQIPKQKLFVGDQWTWCYVPDCAHAAF